MSDSSLILYDRIPNEGLTNAINAYGDDIAKSGFMGCSNISQGRILAWECFTKRTTAIALGERYHLMLGRLVMRGDAMLADFHSLGGKTKIKEYSPNACEVEFLVDDESLTVRITWEQAKAEKWPYAKDGKTLKDNWATELGRQDMLWNRVVSRGVRRLRPGIVCGYYTADEIEDLDELPTIEGQVVNRGSEKAANGNSNGKAKKPTTPKTPVTPTMPEASQPGEVIDAEYEVTPDGESDSTTPAKSALITAIRKHWEQLQVSLEDQAKQVGNERCGRPGAAALVGLDVEQLTNLEAKLRAVSENASKMNEASTQEEVPFDIDEEPTGPISDIQIAAAKELIKKLQATEPLITDTIKEQLAIIGKAKLSELSAAQANVLISDLKKGDVKLSGTAMYFQESLQPVPHYATEAGN